MHVLVLDDDKLIVELCTLMLSNGGVPYETHQHPEELFKSGIDPKITHVLMDIRLGNVNGVELCRSLRTRVGKSLKIIAMTAMADSKVLRDSLDDFDGVLRKPFRSDELYALLGTNDRFSVVRKMTNNDEELFQSVLADFMGETDRDIQAVEKAIADQRSDTMLLLVHRLSGRVGQFGFRDLSTSLRQIEIELEKGGAAEKMKERWNELKERLVAALAEIRNSP
jgi:DNA-binding response OmpR family regulator